MTKEEAKKELSKLIFELGFEDNIDDKVCALNMAIQALSKEPCEKCVYSTKDGYCQYDDISETIPPLEPCETCGYAEGSPFCLQYCPYDAERKKEQEPTVQEKQAKSEKYQKAYDDGYNNGYTQARFDYEQEPKEREDYLLQSFVEALKVLQAENDDLKEKLKQKSCEDAISRDAVEQMIKAEMPERGAWEIGGNIGDIEKQTVCEVCVDLLQGLNELPPVTQKWIPVSERLPEIADVYRVTRYYPNNVMNPKYLVDACAFDGSNIWYNDNRINHERGYANNVIAWQENPEPYEPQESEE